MTRRMKFLLAFPFLARVHAIAMGGGILAVFRLFETFDREGEDGQWIENVYLAPWGYWVKAR